MQCVRQVAAGDNIMRGGDGVMMLGAQPRVRELLRMTWYSPLEVSSAEVQSLSPLTYHIDSDSCDIVNMALCAAHL